MQLATEVTLKDVQKILGMAGIPVITLKGPYVGNILYNEPIDRPYCDLDLLVKPQDFKRSFSLLVQKGFRPIPGNPSRCSSEEAYYCKGIAAPHGVRVELHKDLSSHGRYPVNIDEMISRAQPFSMGKTSALGFCPEDLLLHLCIHIVKTYFIVEEKHFKDIALLINRRAIKWEKFIDLARRARCTVGAYFVLQAAKNIHGALVPNHVLDMLRPGLFRKLWLGHLLNTYAFPVYKKDDGHYLSGQILLGLPLIDNFSDWAPLAARYFKMRVKDIFKYYVGNH